MVRISKKERKNTFIRMDSFSCDHDKIKFITGFVISLDNVYEFCSRHLQYLKHVSSRKFGVQCALNLSKFVLTRIKIELIYVTFKSALNISCQKKS